MNAMLTASPAKPTSLLLEEMGEAIFADLVAAAKARPADEGQARFFAELLVHYPTLARFWDDEAREFQDEAAEDALISGRLALGEAVVLRALAAIWLGHARSAYALDFTDLAALSPEWRLPLVGWISNPFWP